MKPSKDKVLISACLAGHKVRWNGAAKTYLDLLNWATNNNIELIPVCPENELFGTPRAPIHLVQIEDTVSAIMKKKDITEKLKNKCKEIHDRNSDAVAFIGISGSPSCGMSVGVKYRGGFVKGEMHKQSSFPTTESNYLKSSYNRDIFLKKIREYFDDRK